LPGSTDDLLEVSVVAAKGGCTSCSTSLDARTWPDPSSEGFPSLSDFVRNIPSFYGTFQGLKDPELKREDQRVR
jgi:hypothetical protein